MKIKRVVLLLVLGILVASVSVMAQQKGPAGGNEFSCSSDEDCVLKDKPYCCGNNYPDYRDACFHVNETPKDLTCTSASVCPGVVDEKACKCENGVCVGLSKLQCVEKEGQCCLGSDCKTPANVCGEDSYASSFRCDRNCEPLVVCKELTRVRSGSFIPWQKRNESECPEGCRCVGAVVSCPTETGKTMTITAGSSGNIIVITVEKVDASTSLELETESDPTRTRLKAKMENGETKEVKVMPDVAAQAAIERLKLKVCSEENNCAIELKEVGISKELAYELQAERHAKLLGLFERKMQYKAQVSAENGEIIRVQKPWWAFLASSSEE